MKRLSMFLLMAALLASCGQTRHEAVPAGATVLVLGDSISYGTGANPGEDYPTLLAARSGWHIVNAGVPGDTTAGGLERLPDLLDAHSPKLVLVELGGNDFLRQQAIPQVTDNLKAILAQIKASGSTAVLVAVPRFNPIGAAIGTLSDSPIYDQVGEETGTPVIAEILSEVLSERSLKADQIHPNAAGYRKLEEGLAQALQELGFLR